MRILRFESENIKRISAVDITPEGAVESVKPHAPGAVIMEEGEVKK